MENAYYYYYYISQPSPVVVAVFCLCPEKKWQGAVPDEGGSENQSYISGRQRPGTVEPREV